MGLGGICLQIGAAGIKGRLAENFCGRKIRRKNGEESLRIGLHCAEEFWKFHT